MAGCQYLPPSYVCLAPALRGRPVAEPPEREVLRRILPGLTLVAAQQIRNCLT